MNNKSSVKDLMTKVSHVEETAEGLLKGGFAIIGGEEENSPLINPICINSDNCSNCHNSGNCVAGCGAPTTTQAPGGNNVAGLPLSF